MKCRVCGSLVSGAREKEVPAFALGQGGGKVGGNSTCLRCDPWGEACFVGALQPLRWGPMGSPWPWPWPVSRTLTGGRSGSLSVSGLGTCPPESDGGLCIARVGVPCPWPCAGRARAPRCQMQQRAPQPGSGEGGERGGRGRGIQVWAARGNGDLPCLPYVRFRRLPPGPLVGAVRAAPVLWELPDSCRN